MSDLTEDVLTILRNMGPKPPHDLAHLLDVPEPVLAGIIDELREAGRVEEFAGVIRMRRVAA